MVGLLIAETLSALPKMSDSVGPACVSEHGGRLCEHGGRLCERGGQDRKSRSFYKSWL